jgi:hypothetical protein
VTVDGAHTFTGNGSGYGDLFNQVLFQLVGLPFGAHTVKLENTPGVEGGDVDLDYAIVQVGDGNTGTPNNDIWVDDTVGNWTYDATFAADTNSLSPQYFNSTFQCVPSGAGRPRVLTRAVQRSEHSRRAGDIPLLRERRLALRRDVDEPRVIRRRARRRHAPAVQRHAGRVSSAADAVHGERAAHGHAYRRAHKHWRHVHGRRLRDRLALRRGAGPRRSGSAVDERGRL